MTVPGPISETERAVPSLWVTEGGPPVDRRSGLRVSEFHEQYERRNRPVILTDVLGHWPALGKWSPAFFARRYGDRTIQFQRGPVPEMRMDDFIAAVESSRPGHAAPYWTNNPLEGIFPELVEDVMPLPPHLLPNWATRRFLHQGMEKALHRGAMVELYIGGAGGAFPILHWDGQSTHAFLMQIHGRKQYWAWGPDQSEFLYPRLADGFANLSPIGDVERPDFVKYPLFRQARGCQFHLDPGEMLFVPSRWWHTAKMTEPSITLSVNTLNRTNWTGFAEDMTRTARGPSKVAKQAYLGGVRAVNLMRDCLGSAR